MEIMWVWCETFQQLKSQGHSQHTQTESIIRNKLNVDIGTFEILMAVDICWYYWQIWGCWENR